MKLDPLLILLNKNFVPDKKFFFVSGNEVTLMEKISSLILEKLKNERLINLSYIDSLGDYVNETSLFGEKKIYVVKNCKGIVEEKINELKNTDSVFIIVQENSQKIKIIKKLFFRDRDSYLIDCYDLDRASKISILNVFLKDSKIKIKEELFWFLVEKLDNKYIFFENSLKKILQLGQENISLLNIRKVLTIDDTGGEKLFLSLLKKNSEILELYREKIVNTSDVNDLYYYCKFFCQLIIECGNKEEYNKRIPIYLFKEKKFLIDIYNKYNDKKRKMLIDLLASTEKILRKETALSLVFGLRFLLSIKKITVS